MKRIKKVKIRFTPEEIKSVSERAELTKMRTAVFIRNMSFRKEWRIFDSKYLCKQLESYNRMERCILQIINVAERTNSEYLDELKNIKRDFDKCRTFLMNYYGKILNRE